MARPRALTPIEENIIHGEFKNGASQNELSSKYGVSVRTIARIVRNFSDKEPGRNKKVTVELSEQEYNDFIKYADDQALTSKNIIKGFILDFIAYEKGNIKDEFLKKSIADWVCYSNKMKIGR